MPPGNSGESRYVQTPIFNLDEALGPCRQVLSSQLPSQRAGDLDHLS
jgi:hypothetical protein